MVLKMNLNFKVYSSLHMATPDSKNIILIEWKSYIFKILFFFLKA